MKKRICEVSSVIATWALALIPVGMALGSAPKNVFMGIALAAGLVSLVTGKERSRWRTPLTVSYLVFIAVSALSLFNTVDMRDSVRGLFKLAEYFALMTVIAATVRSARDVRRVVACSALACAIVSVDALVQFATGKDLIRWYAVIENIGLRRVTASFVDANVFGIFLSALGPLILGAARYSSRGIQRWALSTVGLLTLVASVLTYSRPTLLALFISMAVIAAVKKDKLAIGLLSAMLVLSPFLAPASVREWARSVDYDWLRFMCNDDRIAAYRNAMQMIKAHPVIGVGTNTFMKNYKLYKEFPEYRGVVTSDYMYAHNNILHLAGENGVVGLAVFLWVLWGIGAYGIRAYRRLKERYAKDICLFLLACCLSFLVNGLTESSMYYSRVSLIFWYLAGMAISVGRLNNEQPA